jgi:hypothetical protein
MTQGSVASTPLVLSTTTYGVTMDRITIAALLLIFNVVSAHASYSDINHDIGTSEFSSAVHVGVGATVSALTVYYLPKDMPIIPKIALGVVAALAAGCASEAMDKNWDNRDLGEWGAGGVAGALSFAIIRKEF